MSRFDRAGRTGRIGMLSAGVVDDGCFGLQDTWSQFAARCVTTWYLTLRTLGVSTPSPHSAS